MAPAAEFTCSLVFSLKLASVVGDENAIAGKSGVRQGGRIWSASILLSALPVTCRLVSISGVDFKLVAEEGSAVVDTFCLRAGGSGLARKSESAHYKSLSVI